MLSRWERLGLRARITLVFALGGLLLSTTIAIVTLTLTRQSLLDDREEVAFAAFTTNGRRMQTQLGDDPDSEGVGAIIESLVTTTGAFPLLRFGDGWVSFSSVVFSEETVPVELTTLVDSGDAGRMRASIGGVPAIVNGVRLPGRDAAYYEAVLIADIEDTINRLSIVLFAVATATTLMAAALGSWASRRALMPLADVRAAAESLAAGELDTRLVAPADADLASLASSFNGMAQSLEDRIQRDGRFASEVSHELRSPLMTLNAAAEVLNNDREQMSERSQTALALLTDDVVRFTQLVEDLLEISRYDVGTAALQAEPLDLVVFVRQAVSHSARPDATVTAIGVAENTLIVADKRRLGQVVANLIDNADRYGAGTIDVGIASQDDTVILMFEDQGPGVPAAERSVIFDRFSRGSAGGRRGYDTGSGLGLSLVAEHVGLHSGRVWVEGRADGQPGARFIVELPLGDIDEVEP